MNWFPVHIDLSFSLSLSLSLSHTLSLTHSHKHTHTNAIAIYIFLIAIYVFLLPLLFYGCFFYFFFLNNRIGIDFQCIRTLIQVCWSSAIELHSRGIFQLFNTSGLPDFFSEAGFTVKGLKIKFRSGGNYLKSCLCWRSAYLVKESIITSFCDVKAYLHYMLSWLYGEMTVDKGETFICEAFAIRLNPTGEQRILL